MQRRARLPLVHAQHGPHVPRGAPVLAADAHAHGRAGDAGRQRLRAPAGAAVGLALGRGRLGQRPQQRRRLCGGRGSQSSTGGCADPGGLGQCGEPGALPAAPECGPRPERPPGAPLN